MRMRWYAPDVKSYSDKLKESDTEPLTRVINKTREVAKGDDVAALRSAINELEQAQKAFSKTLYESNDIARYLYAEYGPVGRRPPRRLLPLSLLATTLRGTNGMFARPSKAPTRPLELYSFEASPYSRLVRETMCELELPYYLHNVGKGAGRPTEWLPPNARKNYVAPTENRRKLVERGGKMQVPYLIDPNTGTALYESAEIQRYLRQTYGA